MRRSTGVLAVLAVLALKADATLAPHSSPVPRSQPPPALAFSPFLKFLPSRPHSSPSHTCSSVLRPRWTRAALLRTGKASGAVLLAAKVEADLAEAASAGNAEHLRSLLVGGADAGGADDWGCTVLHLAVKRGNQEAARVLLEAGAEVHKASSDDETSWSPLHTAAGAGDPGMVELLLAHGAEVARKDDLGDTPLGIALRSKHSEVVKLLRPVVDQARVELESKQSTPAPADPPWGAECKQGNAHFQSGDYSRAAASYTLALSHHSNPPGAAALLYSNRAAALLKLGAFAKAGEDARVGLALFSGGESLPGELQLKRKLEDASGEAGLGVGVEEAAGRTRGVSGDAQTVIAAESPLGVALLDLESTAWFYEMDGRALRPGLKGSKVRFLATLWVTSCITVFVSGPDGRAFGVHLNSAFAMVSVRGRPDGGRWGSGLEMYSGEMQELFRGVDPSQLKISLVGGWKTADHSRTEELRACFPEDDSMWSFSGVVRKWVAEALPGAAMDVSLLNRFEGLTGFAGQEDQSRAVLEGQRFGVVALDSRTGYVVAQTKYVHDSAQHKCGPVPQSVLDEAAANALEVRETLKQIDPGSMPRES